MTEAVVLALVIGAAAGWFLTEKVGNHQLYRARARGVQDGRAERDWEVNALNIRIRRLEGQLLRYCPKQEAQ